MFVIFANEVQHAACSLFTDLYMQQNNGIHGMHLTFVFHHFNLILTTIFFLSLVRFYKRRKVNGMHNIT